MKNISTCIIIVTFNLLVFKTSAQSTFEPSEYYPTDGADEVKQGNDMSLDLLRGASDYDRLESKARATIDAGKLKLGLWSRMNREQRLYDHANLKLHYLLNAEKKDLQNHYQRVSQLTSNERIIATAWENSPTGRRDSRYWHQLSAEERETYRLSYVRHHNPEVFQDSPPKKLVVSESEYAVAWEIRNLSNPNAPSWKELRNFQTKNKFRKYYYSYKLAKISPQIEISEEELADAWEIAQLGNSIIVSWAEITNTRAGEKFRKNYTNMLLNKSDLPIMQSLEEPSMIALANYKSAHK